MQGRTVQCVLRVLRSFGHTLKTRGNTSSWEAVSGVGSAAMVGRARGREASGGGQGNTPGQWAACAASSSCENMAHGRHVTAGCARRGCYGMTCTTPTGFPRMTSNLEPRALKLRGRRWDAWRWVQGLRNNAARQPSIGAAQKHNKYYIRVHYLRACLLILRTRRIPVTGAPTCRPGPGATPAGSCSG